jgi:hypothetical protein
LHATTRSDGEALRQQASLLQHRRCLTITVTCWRSMQTSDGGHWCHNWRGLSHP